MVVLLVLAAQPRRHGHQAEEGRTQALRRLAPAIHFLGFQAVAPRGQDLIQAESIGLVGQQGQQEGANELCVRQPGGVARLAAFEAQHVDEDRRGAAEEDVIRCAVLEAEAVGQQRLCQVEGEHAGGMQHLGIPLVGKAGKCDALVLQDHLPVRAPGRVPARRGRPASSRHSAASRARVGTTVPAAISFWPEGEAEEGFQIGGADGVDDAQNPTVVVEKATGGIAE